MRGVGLVYHLRRILNRAQDKGVLSKENAQLRSEQKKLRRSQALLTKNLHSSRKNQQALYSEIDNLQNAQNIILEQNKTLALKQKKLELQQTKLEEARIKFRHRTIDLFGKMIDLKKAKKTIAEQNARLELQTIELTAQKEKAAKFHQRFRQRTIELFGKMIDLKKAKKTIAHKNDELAQANATKDKFFSIIAHDLRNPISGFLNLTELMVTDLHKLNEEEKERFTKNLNTSAKNLHMLMENLLQWSRAQIGKIQSTPSQQPICPLLEEQIDILNTSIQQKQILIYLASSDAHNACFDRNLLGTVFRNILSNAIKFSHPEGSIYISTQINEKQLAIIIKDEGIGMSQEIQEKIFDIGTWHSQKGTCNEKGTGLGLIICKEFVELNNGSIEFKSALNKGTTFRILLPVTKQ